MYEIEGPYVVSQHLPPIARRRTLSDLHRSQISRQEDRFPGSSASGVAPGWAIVFGGESIFTARAHCSATGFG